MKKFVVFDNTGDIIRYGISAVDDIQKQTRGNEKAVAVDRLERNFDLDNRVENPKGSSPKVVKKHR